MYNLKNNLSTRQKNLQLAGSRAVTTNKKCPFQFLKNSLSEYLIISVWCQLPFRLCSQTVEDMSQCLGNTFFFFYFIRICLFSWMY